jgi:hypothetical protein
MRSIRKGAALVGALAIYAALAVYGGPGAMVPVVRSSLTTAASLTLTTPDDRLSSTVRVEPVSATEADDEAARHQTCNLFRQMVEGSDYLSADEQGQLMSEMADVVQDTGDSDLVQAVANMRQGARDSNPQQFAAGMRALSQSCGVPYE